MPDGGTLDRSRDFLRGLAPLPPEGPGMEAFGFGGGAAPTLPARNPDNRDSSVAPAGPPVGPTPTLGSSPVKASSNEGTGDTGAPYTVKPLPKSYGKWKNLSRAAKPGSLFAIIASGLASEGDSVAAENEMARRAYLDRMKGEEDRSTTALRNAQAAGTGGFRPPNPVTPRTGSPFDWMTPNRKHTGTISYDQSDPEDLARKLAGLPAGAVRYHPPQSSGGAAATAAGRKVLGYAKKDDGTYLAQLADGSTMDMPKGFEPPKNMGPGDAPKPQKESLIDALKPKAGEGDKKPAGGGTISNPSGLVMDTKTGKTITRAEAARLQAAGR